MNRSEVIETLRRHQEHLHAIGVTHAAVFGSVATGDNRPDSDVDILVELSPMRRTVFDLAGIEYAIADLVAGNIHVAISDQLKPVLRSSVLADAVFAF